MVVRVTGKDGLVSSCLTYTYYVENGDIGSQTGQDINR